MEIADRVALLTGGAIGTGRAIALALVSAGAKVAICGLDEAGAHEIAAVASARCRSETVDVTTFPTRAPHWSEMYAGRSS